MVNRVIVKKKHDYFGDRTPAPVSYFNPGITESGQCYYGQNQEYLMPDYTWQHYRPGHPRTENPFQPLPDHPLWPDARPVMRRVQEYDDSLDYQQGTQLIRDPYSRRVNEKTRPKGVWTMHGFREYKAEKQIDPDFEERIAFAKTFGY
jgi:hypothetical protein